jgi:PIN domain nuclease of toxin-antitoxin system
MKVLLDTAAFWWFATGSPQLTPRARSVFLDPTNTISLSPISLWELLVKHQIGKLQTTFPIVELFSRARADRAIDSLPLRESAVMRLGSLPPIHRDPFDRLLVCQALDEGMTLLTPDAHVRRYPVQTVWE